MGPSARSVSVGTDEREAAEEPIGDRPWGADGLICFSGLVERVLSLVAPAACSVPEGEEQEFFQVRFENPPVVLCAFGLLASELAGRRLQVR